MKGVILAAGFGARLDPLTRDRPKPLVPLLERPLIDYTIEAFVQCGFTELGVILGHNGRVLQHYLGDGSRYGLAIHCLHNHLYPRGNATSILAARDFVGQEPFVVSMSDHLISPQILSTLLSHIHIADHSVLCVDFEAKAAPLLNDATKVWLARDGYVVRIGKGLKRWHAVDVGVFLFQPRILDHIVEMLHHCDGPYTITRAVRRMIAHGDRLGTCDVSGHFWLDIDTWEDLIYARKVLRIGLSRLDLQASELSEEGIYANRYFGQSA